MTKEQTVDSFIIVNNVGESILQLNQFIREGEFIKVTINEFEAKYAEIFYYKKPTSPEGLIKIGDLTIDHNLYNRMMDSKYFNFHNLAKTPYVILFKLKESFKIPIGPLEIGVLMEHETKMSEVFNSLLLKLRLFKHGDINHSLTFQKIAETNTIVMRSMKSISPVSRELYQISYEELNSLKEYLEKDLNYNQLTELALENFKVSYEVFNHQIRYVNLVTALESLFNVSPNQIAVTISRHTALILAENKFEFDKLYKKVKDMYNVRNQIVHGTGEGKSQAILYMAELQDIVRKVIFYCMGINMSKKQLFAFLNSKGY